MLRKELGHRDGWSLWPSFNGGWFPSTKPLIRANRKAGGAQCGKTAR